MSEVAEAPPAQGTTVAKPAVTEVPAFTDASGALKTLKSGEFPRTREGRVAFCDYRIACFDRAKQAWIDRKEEIARADDPEFQRQRKIDRLKEQLAKLEAEV